MSMSALGHKRTCAVQNAMSALPPKADMCGANGDVRFVPIADIAERCGDQTRNTAARGRMTLISVNSPGLVSTSIDPECCLTTMS